MGNQEQESHDGHHNDDDNNIRWIFKNEKNIFSHIK
jgi:hypothetical protein